MIDIQSISKTFQQWSESIHLYNSLSVTIEAWEFVMLTGQSGSGKTTLFNIVAGLEKADEWEVMINGKNIQSLSSNERSSFFAKTISFVFQSFHLVPQLTVRENLELPWDLSMIKQRYSVEEILWLVGIDKKINSYPDQLSWGEQQRVAIARAFMYKTPVLLADEPTGNLDLWNSENIMQLIKQLQKKTWVTIFMITHEQELLHRADRTITMSELLTQ